MSQLRRMKLEKKVNIIKNQGFQNFGGKGTESPPQRLFKANEYFQKLILQAEKKVKKNTKNNQMGIKMDPKMQARFRNRERSKSKLTWRRKKEDFSSQLAESMDQRTNEAKFSFVDQILALTKRNKQVKEKDQVQNREKTYQADDEIVHLRYFHPMIILAEYPRSHLLIPSETN